MQLPLVPYYETCDEDGPCAPYFTGHITDADGRVMCRADSEERAIELVDCVDGLSANIEALRSRLAEVEAQRAELKVALTTANAKCADEIERLREFIRNGVELGYIVIPDKGDPARDIIDRICGGEK